jgi:hypothetical protein
MAGMLRRVAGGRTVGVGDGLAVGVAGGVVGGVTGGVVGGVPGGVSEGDGDSVTIGDTSSAIAGCGPRVSIAAAAISSSDNILAESAITARPVRAKNPSLQQYARRQRA